MPPFSYWMQWPRCYMYTIASCMGMGWIYHYFFVIIFHTLIKGMLFLQSTRIWPAGRITSTPIQIPQTSSTPATTAWRSCGTMVGEYRPSRIPWLRTTKENFTGIRGLGWRGRIWWCRFWWIHMTSTFKYILLYINLSAKFKHTWEFRPCDFHGTGASKYSTYHVYCWILSSKNRCICMWWHFKPLLYASFKNVYS